MNKKNADRLKGALIYIGWGIVAMLAISILVVIAALVGWGV
jgi:hypothetical protein